MEIKDLALVSVGSITAGLAIIRYVNEWKDANIKELDRFKATLKAELNLISGWTKPYPDSSYKDYMKREEFDSFWFPSRVIFKFDYPTLKKILNSKNIKLLGEDFTIDSLLLLQTIENFYQYHEEYRKFVLSYPKLFLEYSSTPYLNYKIVEGIKNEDERNYLEKVYRYNYTLHHDLIGNLDTIKTLCYWHKTLERKIKQIKEPHNVWISISNIMGYIFISIGLLYLGFFIYQTIVNSYLTVLHKVFHR